MNERSGVASSTNVGDASTSILETRAVDSRTLSPRDGGFVATHAPFRFSTRIDASGAKVADLGGAWSVGLHVTRMGRQGAMAPLTTTAPTQQGAHVAIDRGQGVTEWFSHDARGLEEGVDIATRPSGEGALLVEVAIEGLTPALAANGKSVSLRDARGRQLLTYGQLAVKDAEGRAIAASMKVVGNTVALTVDDAAARYPIEIDPLVWVEATELLASDGAADAYFGQSVAISGPLAIVGDTATRSTYVFARSGSGWVQQEELTSSGGVGALVGTTAVIGNAWDAGGYAYVFTQSGAIWGAPQMLAAADNAVADHFGISVAFDGTSAVVGAFTKTVGSNSGQGVAYVFAQTGTVWAEQQELVASDGEANDGFGWSVGVSGSSIVIGAYTAGPTYEEGAAYIFARSGTGWTQQQRLAPSDLDSEDWFGSSVAIDGTSLLVGAANRRLGANASQGAVYSFTQEGTAWTQQQELVASDPGPDAYFGNSLAIEGTTAVIGASNTGASATEGSAYVFTLGSTGWSQLQELASPAGGTEDTFGNSVGISGGVVIVGATGATVGSNANQGAAFVFVTEHTNGDPCTSPSDCVSGFCVDGVCCGTACTGTCTACAAALTGAADGTCGNTLSGLAPHDDCPGTSCAAGAFTESVCNGAGACRAATTSCAPYACNALGTACDTSCADDSSCGTADHCVAGACVARKATGATCTAADECASSFCADGVCCNVACTGKCEACVLVSTGHPDGTCDLSLAGKDPHGDCTGATCSGSTLSLNACNGSGACATTTSSCAPATCNAAGTACKGSCTTSSDCGTGAFCSAAGQCTATKSLGATCSSAAECTNGFCVDGVCCNSACTGACSACTATLKGAGTDGICGFASSGSLDPACPATICTSAGVGPGVCNGAGTCVAASPTSCGGFGCNAAGTACNAACSVDSDCAAGSYCSGGVCVAKRAIGSACSAANVCASGFCADGFCCNSACTDTCAACSADKSGVFGSDGTCNPIAAGTDPDDECGGTTGATCTGATLTTNACNGAGACKSSPVACANNFACASSTACAATCTTDVGCVATAYCAAGSCLPKVANGGACSLADACASGFCVDGVCCGSACDGQCEACNATPLTAGTCVAVTGKPQGARVACNGTDAACVGQCDGTHTDACAYPSVGVSCGAGCTGHANAICDNTGNCLPPADCAGNLACDATTNKCKTVCTVSADCVGGTTCDTTDGTCKAVTATCSSDGSASIPVDTTQPTVACTPFVCDPSSGGCYASCSDTTDCATGFVCNLSGASGVCSASAATSTTSKGGCDVAGAGRGDTTSNALPAVALLAAIGAFTRRTRRLRMRS